MAIRKIHQAAQQAENRHLDTPIYRAQELCLHELCDPDTLTQSYIDIPVNSIVSLGHRNFCEKGDTWRSGVQKLHGDEWGDAVFNYFESEIRDNSFPAKGSRRELRMYAHGGACDCGNGVHRLVAGMAWLSHKYGTNAMLKQVNLTHSKLLPFVKEVLIEAKRNNCEVSLLTNGQTLLVNSRYSDQYLEQAIALTAANGESTYYAWGKVSQQITKIPPPTKRSLFASLFGSKKGDTQRDQLHSSINKEGRFTHIPGYVVDAMLNDTWLINQNAA